MPEVWLFQAVLQKEITTTLPDHKGVPVWGIALGMGMVTESF